MSRVPRSTFCSHEPWQVFRKNKFADVPLVVVSKSTRHGVPTCIYLESVSRSFPRVRDEYTLETRNRIQTETLQKVQCGLKTISGQKRDNAFCVKKIAEIDYIHITVCTLDDASGIGRFACFAIERCRASDHIRLGAFLLKKYSIPSCDENIDSYNQRPTD